MPINIEKLIELADDLVSSIRHAYSKGEPLEQTNHMRRAIEQYEQYVEKPCPTCHQIRGRK